MKQGVTEAGSALAAWQGHFLLHLCHHWRFSFGKKEQEGQKKGNWTGLQDRRRSTKWYKYTRGCFGRETTKTTLKTPFFSVCYISLAIYHLFCGVDFGKSRRKCKLLIISVFGRLRKTQSPTTTFKSALGKPQLAPKITKCIKKLHFFWSCRDRFFQKHCRVMAWWSVHVFSMLCYFTLCYFQGENTTAAVNILSRL